MEITQSQEIRCFGGPDDPLMMAYHDDEWGAPLHDEQAFFEFLCLEGAQAGLSWRTILHKRECYREVFDDFEAEKVAAHTYADRQRLLADPGIVRNKLKVNAFSVNAQLFLDVQKGFGTFDAYIWSFTGHKTLRRSGELNMENTPVSTPESDAMTKDLKKRGFKFVGTTICYAFMQATGMVNDHITACIKAPQA
jgi:DNA-3-methyladenine glycosylase I